MCLDSSSPPPPPVPRLLLLRLLLPVFVAVLCCCFSAPCPHFFFLFLLANIRSLALFSSFFSLSIAPLLLSINFLLANNLAMRLIYCQDCGHCPEPLEWTRHALSLRFPALTWTENRLLFVRFRGSEMGGERRGSSEWSVPPQTEAISGVVVRP